MDDMDGWREKKNLGNLCWQRDLDDAEVIYKNHMFLHKHPVLENWNQTKDFFES